ncbi:unnamed protein product, partial [Prorocentrum cordatum]
GAAVAVQVLNSSEVARSWMSVSFAGVELVDLVAFQARLAPVRRAVAERDLAALNQDALRGTGRAKLASEMISAARRKARLWVPPAKQFTLRAARVGDSFNADPEAKLTALADDWAPVPARPPTFPLRAKLRAQKFVTACDYPSMAPPSGLRLPDYLLVPFAGWLCLGRHQASMVSHARRGPVTVKGQRDYGIDRSPDSVRMLGLRNTDMKVISAMLSASFTPILQLTTSMAQRGFIAGRQFASNIPEIDVMARVASVAPQAETKRPLLVALDFGQAFPSLSQEHLFAILE